MWISEFESKYSFDKQFYKTIHLVSSFSQISLLLSMTTEKMINVMPLLYY